MPIPQNGCEDGTCPDQDGGCSASACQPSEPKTCGQALTILNGRVDSCAAGTNPDISVTCRVTCDEGFELKGAMSCFKENATWSDSFCVNKSTTLLATPVVQASLQLSVPSYFPEVKADVMTRMFNLMATSIAKTCDVPQDMVTIMGAYSTSTRKTSLRRRLADETKLFVNFLVAVPSGATWNVDDIVKSLKSISGDEVTKLFQEEFAEFPWIEEVKVFGVSEPRITTAVIPEISAAPSFQPPERQVPVVAVALGTLFCVFALGTIGYLLHEKRLFVSKEDCASTQELSEI